MLKSLLYCRFFLYNIGKKMLNGTNIEVFIISKMIKNTVESKVLKIVTSNFTDLTDFYLFIYL